MTEPDRLIRLSEVLRLVPLKRSTIYARVSAGTFPARRDLGGGVVAWSEREVREWMDQLPVLTNQASLGVVSGVADGERDKDAA